MRAKLLVGRSQTFLMCFFVCGFCCLLPLTLVYYIFDKNASAFLYIFGFYFIPVRWEFSTSVEKYPEHPYLDLFPFCFIKTEQLGVLNILFQSWTFSFSTSYAGQPAEPPVIGSRKALFGTRSRSLPSLRGSRSFCLGRNLRQIPEKELFRGPLSSIRMV